MATAPSNWLPDAGLRLVAVPTESVGAEVVAPADEGRSDPRVEAANRATSINTVRRFDGFTDRPFRLPTPTVWMGSW